MGRLSDGGGDADDDDDNTRGGGKDRRRDVKVIMKEGKTKIKRPKLWVRTGNKVERNEEPGESGEEERKGEGEGEARAWC